MYKNKVTKTNVPHCTLNAFDLITALRAKQLRMFGYFTEKARMSTYVRNTKKKKYLQDFVSKAEISKASSSTHSG